VVVDWVLGQPQRVASGILVDEDPGAIWELGDYRHPRTVGVGLGGDIVNDWAPFLQVSAHLMRELLAMERIALVGVVAYYLMVVEPALLKSVSPSEPLSKIVELTSTSAPRWE